MKPKPLFAILLTLLCCLTALAETPHIDLTRTREKAKQALLFSKERGYNSRYCILIDMSLPSGIKRFMVWDFKKNNANIRPGKPWLRAKPMVGRVE